MYNASFNASSNNCLRPNQLAVRPHTLSNAQEDTAQPEEEKKILAQLIHELENSKDILPLLSVMGWANRWYPDESPRSLFYSRLGHELARSSMWGDAEARPSPESMLYPTGTKYNFAKPTIAQPIHRAPPSVLFHTGHKYKPAEAAVSLLIKNQLLNLRQEGANFAQRVSRMCFEEASLELAALLRMHVCTYPRHDLSTLVSALHGAASDLSVHYKVRELCEATANQCSGSNERDVHSMVTDHSLQDIPRVILDMDRIDRNVEMVAALFRVQADPTVEVAELTKRLCRSPSATAARSPESESDLRIRIRTGLRNIEANTDSWKPRDPRVKAAMLEAIREDDASFSGRAASAEAPDVLSPTPDSGPL